MKEKKKRRKPIEERERIEVDGVDRRLGWIAENKPEVLIGLIAEGYSRWPAYMSALNKVGISCVDFANMAQELDYDPGVYGQITGYWPDEW